MLAFLKTVRTDIDGRTRIPPITISILILELGFPSV